MNVGVGYLVKEGKLHSRVMDTMVFGNVYSDFQNLAAVSNRIDKSFKGYSPALLFSELSVAGTG
jgi:predicted Zn-dependent protease